MKIEIRQFIPELKDVVIESDDLGILFDSTPPYYGFQSNAKTDDKYSVQLSLLNNIADNIRELIEISKEWVYEKLW